MFWISDGGFPSVLHGKTVLDIGIVPVQRESSDGGWGCRRGRSERVEPRTRPDKAEERGLARPGGYPEEEDCRGIRAGKDERTQRGIPSCLRSDTLGLPSKEEKRVPPVRQ